MSEPPLLLALNILRDQRPSVAAGVVKLARKIEPNWQRIDEKAAVGNIVNLLREAGEFLRGGPEDAFLSVVRDIMRMRRMGGFELSDFVSIFFCFMPVMRRMLVTQAPTPLEGLRAYDAIEGVVLPMMSRLTAAAVATVEETTRPEGTKLQNLREKFAMVDVEGELAEIPAFLVERTQE